MKTAVTLTSIQSYHTNNNLETQRQSVAKFILSETRAGRWTWISKIAANAKILGHSELSQKSSAARALKGLKGVVIELEWFEWILHRGVPCKPKGSVRVVEVWAMVLKNSQIKI